MKIAILSMQKIINYGSVLQAYSLKKMLEKVSGEKVFFMDIDEDNKISVDMPVKDRDDYKAPKRKLGPFEFIKKRVMFLKQKKQAFPMITKFMEEEFDTPLDEDYDLVVVGSDEVFKSTDSIRLQLYGDIKNAKTKVTYAASCGSAVAEGIPDDKKEIVRRALENYSKMSVRDKGTHDYIKALYDGEIVYNLDPVLAGNLYSIQHKPVDLKNYLIVYAYNNRFNDEKEIAQIKSFAKKHGLKTVCFGGVLTWCDKYIAVPPLRLLDYFYYADYVVTDTFHGTIFSIINRIQFCSFIRPTNQNKLGDLLERMGLSDRLISKGDDLEEKLTQKIDYDRVEKVLDAERKKSLEYLKECVELAGK
ncbi:MAG: polysaccharide pyruvyl transferase family protein [Butyrivibrio sp.]|nr:polysaccharide pyruvyl transferase family protein [Butyrivibrio sp.]